MKRFVPCALISALLLSGCAAGGVSASHRDLEQMRLVQTLGMDRDASGGVTLSAVCSAPRAEGKPMLLRGGGTGILDAMDTLQAHAVEGELFFGHVNYLLIGRAAAEAGLTLPEPTLRTLEILFDGFGLGDRETQLNQLRLAGEEVDRQTAELRQQMAGRCRSYRLLGFCAGAAVLVLVL